MRYCPQHNEASKCALHCLLNSSYIYLYRVFIIFFLNFMCYSYCILTLCIYFIVLLHAVDVCVHLWQEWPCICNRVTCLGVLTSIFWNDVQTTIIHMGSDVIVTRLDSSYRWKIKSLKHGRCSSQMLGAGKDYCNSHYKRDRYSTW